MTSFLTSSARPYVVSVEVARTSHSNSPPRESGRNDEYSSTCPYAAVMMIGLDQIVPSYSTEPVNRVWSYGENHSGSRKCPPDTCACQPPLFHPMRAAHESRRG